MTTIKWNFKTIKMLVENMIGGEIFSKGSKYEIGYTNIDGNSTGVLNADKVDVIKIIERNYDIKIVA